jgi:superfamily II DNA helicase RecQ
MAMVNSAEWQQVFANWDDSMVALCYDEVHMIFEEWRKSYPLIPSLRAWFTMAGVLALTATAYVV